MMSSVARLPRVLLLTLWPPDAKYKPFRKYVDALPADHVAWASLQPGETGDVPAFQHAAFVPVGLHWRLRRTGIGWWWVHEWQAVRQARRIATWAREFRPDVLWVLPELGVAPVAPVLKRLLRIPLHATSHDAHETARFIVPPLYYPFYDRSVRRAYAASDSVDTISQDLLEHLQEDFPHLAGSNTLVFPPSLSRSQMATTPARWPHEAGDRVRRIGLCGSMRTSAKQWAEFLGTLARLPYCFEIVAYAYADAFPTTELPPNVRLTVPGFAATETDLIRAFREARVDACHLGLWNEPERSLFAKTSLSQKLTTYTAAGLPVILDGPEDSAAWRLLNPAKAGVLATGPLDRLLADAGWWTEMAANSLGLCRTHFDQVSNMKRFVELLARTGQRTSNKEREGNAR